MGESLVAFCHPVGFFFALDRPTRVLRGVEELERQLLGHALAAALTGEADDPATGEREPALRPDLNRDLVRGATNPPGFDLEQGSGVTKRRLEHLERLLL